MKKIFTVILNSAFLILNCTAQTNVSGFISANTTWNLAGSPYVVVGNILVMQSVTLTIDAGVVVKFNDSTAIQVNGELDAIGTATNRITFTSNKPVPAAGDWGKIQFTNLSNGAVFDTSGNYVSGNVMQYCNVLYGGALGYGVIHIFNSSLDVSNCQINYSGAGGILCSGFVKVDSTSIRNCTGVGLSISITASSYCTYTIEYDTLEYNAHGGINGYVYFPSCPNGVVNVNKNYFTHNSYNSGLFLSSSLKLVISENEFLNNSSQYEGGAIRINGGLARVFISENEFLNDSAESGGAIYLQGGSATIACNRFIHNKGYHSSTIELDKTQNDTIRNNIFNGNKAINSSLNSSVVHFGMDTYSTEVFTNNYLANDSTPGGATVSMQGFASGNNITHFYVAGNEFSSNTANAEISLSVGSNNSTLQFAQILVNNFLSANTQYAIANNVSFSGPSIDADSNYWNSASTPHVDSAIYDFFDYANLSVVYYSPILTSPVIIDTSCVPDFPTAISNIEPSNFTSTSTLFPNPFSQHATIKFPTALHSATIRLYNLYGQLVQEKNNISGREIILTRENLGSGVYVYEVSDVQKKICTGKAVVY